MSPRLISRTEWGAKAPTGPVHTVPLAERTAFVVHYDGGTEITQPVGDAATYADLRGIQAFHTGPSRRWSDIGYNYVVYQDGTIAEGRGRDAVGAHCPGFNRSGIGVQVRIGGNQKPSPAALAAVRWLRDDLRAKGAPLTTTMGHCDGFATSCPGSLLLAWVRAGMPASRVGQVLARPVASVKQASRKLVRKVQPAARKAARRPVLATGSRGADVALVQRFLGVGSDGIFGPATQAAVKRYQRMRGLAADGVVGPATWKAMGL